MVADGGTFCTVDDVSFATLVVLVFVDGTHDEDGINVVVAVFDASCTTNGIHSSVVTSHT